jgi:hypothetical protein
MEENEICIIVLDEENKEHIINVQNDIKYEDLKKLIILALNKNNDLEILYKGQIINESNKIIHLDDNEIIYLVSPNRNEDDGEDSDSSSSDDIHNEIYEEGKEKKINIKFHEKKSKEDDDDDDDGDMKTVDLSGLLKLCLLIHISKNMDDYTIGIIENYKLIEIIFTLRNMVDDKKDIKEDIKNVLSQKTGNNILAYSSYVNNVVGKKEINDLINLFKGNKKKEIIKYWSKLSKYNDFNKLFEMNFSKALEMSYFEYNLVSLSIIEKKNKKKYLDSKKKCNNCQSRYLFHGTQIDPISKIVTNGFLYTKKAFYGMGIYFSDMLDYIGFYCGGKNYDDRRKNFGKTIPVGETFSCVASEIYYDKTKKKEIYDLEYHVPEIKDHFPTYEEIKQKYPNKMVEKNGIHYIRIEPEKGQVRAKKEIPLDERRGNFIGTEFVITEMDQILPLYGLTLKRSEYFVIWRDPNFSRNNNNTKYLSEIIMKLKEIAEMNIYCVSRTEEALELISRKRYNKIILISNVGNDNGGKSFIEKARELLGFDAMILFFTRNLNLNWMRNYKNALFTNKEEHCIEYVTNYNENGLIALKNKIEKYYKIKIMNFTEDFLKFPKFVNKKKFCELNFEILKENYKKVIILKKGTRKALFMNKDGIVLFSSYQGKEINPFIWYVTIFGNEISFYSNHYYLSGITELNVVLAEEYNSKKWKFKLINNEYMFYLENENNVLTVDKNNVTLSKFNRNKLQLFSFKLINFN